jgi:hypothetical protein
LEGDIWKTELESTIKIDRGLETRRIKNGRDSEDQQGSGSGGIWGIFANQRGSYSRS